MIRIKSRTTLTMLVCAWCTLAFSTLASAQMIEISMYDDVTASGGPSGGQAEVYVEFFDTTDIPPGVSHYNYYSGVAVSGTGGSDSAQGAGLGPYTLHLPYYDYDDDYDLEAGVDLTCSEAGPQTGFLGPMLIILIRAFNYHYNFAQQDETGIYYEVDPDSEGRLCAAPILKWGNTHLRMTSVGMAVGRVLYFCFPGCEAGHNGPVIGSQWAYTPAGECLN